MGQYTPELDWDYLDLSPPEGLDSLMRFRLTYLGTLPPVGRTNCPKEKWDIRRQIHPQLADLYTQHPVLSQPSKILTWVTGEKAKVQDPRMASREIIKRGEFEFIPLVRKTMFLACELEIIYLRPGIPGSLLTAKGDLDNHMNTLFDGLKVPTASDMDHRGGEIPTPMHCLLEDDSMVTGLSIKTDRLLAPPAGVEHYAHLLIDVNIKVMQLDGSNTGFVGD